MKQTILVVDDNVKTCSNLKRMLVQLSYDVEIAHDGEEALAALEKIKPACMLLDVRMPGMNGVGAFNLTRLKYPDLKIIIITAFKDPDAKKRFLEKGAFAFLEKPLIIEELQFEIEMALSVSQKQ